MAASDVETAAEEYDGGLAPSGADGASSEGSVDGRDARGGVYAISVAAELVGTGQQNIRQYERKGLLTPGKDRRRHSPLQRKRPYDATQDRGGVVGRRAEPGRREAGAGVGGGEPGGLSEDNRGLADDNRELRADNRGLRKDLKRARGTTGVDE